MLDFIFTSFGVSLYSFTFSTATMLVSRSEDILTSQVREAVSFMLKKAKSHIVKMYILKKERKHK